MCSPKVQAFLYGRNKMAEKEANWNMAKSGLLMVMWCIQSRLFSKSREFQTVGVSKVCRHLFWEAGLCPSKLTDVNLSLRFTLQLRFTDFINLPPLENNHLKKNSLGSPLTFIHRQGLLVEAFWKMAQSVWFVSGFTISSQKKQYEIVSFQYDWKIGDF